MNIKKIINFNNLKLKNHINGSKLIGKNYGFSDLLLYAHIIDEGIILQTDGSFLSSFWFKGSDLETSSDEELNILTIQLNSALNLVGSGWMFHIDTIRYISNEYTESTNCFFTDPTSLIVDEERRNLYKNEGKHYENKYVFSITYCPSIGVSNKLSNFFLKESEQHNYEYIANLNNFKLKLNEVTDLLTLNLNFKKMTNQELISYLSWCITGENISLSIPQRKGFFLKHFLASKDLECNDVCKIGDNYIQTVTISGFPNESYPAILDGLNYLTFEYRWSTRFILLNKHDASKIINRVSNLWFQKRINAIDTIKMSLAIDSHVKVNINAENHYLDAEKARATSDLGESKFGYYTSTVILMHKNLETLNNMSNQIRNFFRTHGFQSQVETYHTIEAYLGSLPGYSYANIRKWLINTNNLADIMPNTSIWSGLEKNPCKMYPPNSPPLFFARTNGHTPIRISLHVEDNGHTLIIGPTGSGKSTLLNFIITQHFKYKNSRVFVFDKNKSSLPLCYACGGNFFDIGAENNDTYFQPLADLDSDIDFDFAKNWIEELCELNSVDATISDTQALAIHKALELMKIETDVERRTISYFRHLVQDYERSITFILDKFSKENRNINNVSNVNSGFVAKIFDSNLGRLKIENNKFNVFEMSKLMEQGDKVVIPAIKYLIHIITKQFDANIPTLIVFDESFVFFNHYLFREKIIELVKIARKFNVAIIFATQELNDLFKFEELRSALKVNCSTKIFLPNKKANTVDQRQQYRAMDLNDKQIELISKGIKGEYFYFSDLGRRKFNLNLNESDITYAFVARTSNYDIKNAQEIYNVDKEMFGYNWLKTLGYSKSICDRWLYFKEQLKNEKQII